MSEVYRESSQNSIPTGVRRWLSCKYALPQVDQLSGQTAGPQEGYNSDYSCKNPQIVDLAKEQGIKTDQYTSQTGDVVLEAVQLFEDSNVYNPSLQEVLHKVCGKCPYYSPKDS